MAAAISLAWAEAPPLLPHKRVQVMVREETDPALEQVDRADARLDLTSEGR